jgi:hypothetical protein
MPYSIGHLLLIKQEGYSKVKSQRILHDVYRTIYCLHMDVIFAWQNENLPKENSRRDKYYWVQFF